MLYISQVHFVYLQPMATPGAVMEIQGQSGEQASLTQGSLWSLHVNCDPSEETFPISRCSSHSNLVNLSRRPHQCPWRERSRVRG